MFNKYMDNKYNLKGKRFGNLLVIDKTINPKNKSTRTFWKCKCDCGNYSIVSTHDLISEKTQNCWDCAHKKTGTAKRNDLTGKRFGKLTVTKMLYGIKDNSGRKRTYCECLCDCGNSVTKNVDTLRPGKYSSCGCGKKEIGNLFARNIVGEKFGRLTVIKELSDYTPRKVMCRCECGNVITTSKTDVMSLHTQSCGCLQKEMASLHNEKDWTGYISDFGVKAISRSGKNKNGLWLWEYECPLCHNHFISLPANVADGNVSSCGCRKRSSKEDFIEQILISNSIPFQSQYSFPDCKNIYPLRFDFAILNNEIPILLIEYDGKQHFEPIEYWGGQDAFLLRQKCDGIKNEYCKSNHIPLLRLKYTLSNEQIKDKILNTIYP